MPGTNSLGSGTEDTNTQDTYIPGQIYNVVGGLTASELQDPTTYNNALPVEIGFVKDPGASANAIIVSNVSNTDVFVTLNKNSPNRSGDDSDSRENQCEVSSFYLSAGVASHFAVDPDLMILSLSADVPTGSGGRVQTTGVGYTFTTLQDYDIVIKDGRPDGLSFIKVAKANNRLYTIVTNNSSYPVTMCIKTADTVFQDGNEGLNRERQDRRPDEGSEPKITRLIKPQGRLHIDVSPCTYTVRVLQTNAETDQGSDGYVLSDETTPPVDDYTEYTRCAVQVVGGNVVAIVNTEDGQTLETVKYDTEVVKFVTPKIVRNR